MKEYLGIKTLKAKPMTLGVYNDYRGWVIPANEDSNANGFLVEYADGYISWSPEKAFSEAYIELGVNPLVETVIPMKSSDFKERFKAEYAQLKIRTDGLTTMVTKLKNDELPFKPKCSLELLTEQLVTMRKYLELLEERARIEDIIL